MTRAWALLPEALNMKGLLLQQSKETFTLAMGLAALTTGREESKLVGRALSTRWASLAEEGSSLGG